MRIREKGKGESNGRDHVGCSKSCLARGRIATDVRLRDTHSGLAGGWYRLLQTGKGLADHAIGILTQKDCNILGGIISPERKICEPLGSAAAQRGFKGFLAQSNADKDTGTTLRLSDSIALLPPDVEYASLTPLGRTPILRLSETVGSIEKTSSRTPEPLALGPPASTALDL